MKEDSGTQDVTDTSKKKKKKLTSERNKHNTTQIALEWAIRLRMKNT